MQEADKKTPANKVLFNLTFAGGVMICRGIGLIMEKMSDLKQLSSVIRDFRIAPVQIPDEILLAKQNIQRMFIQFVPHFQ